MAIADCPHMYLTWGWWVWLEFGSGGHAAFVSVADRLRTEFSAVVVDDLSNPDEAGKEYLWLLVGTSRLLLMRRHEWVALGAFYPDVPQVLRVGAAFAATRRGWRWPLYDVWGWLVGHRGRSGLPVNVAANQTD